MRPDPDHRAEPTTSARSRDRAGAAGSAGEPVPAGRPWVRVLRDVVPALVIGVFLTFVATSVWYGADEWDDEGSWMADAALRAPDALAYALLWTSALALVVRRVHPPVVLAVTIAPAVLYLALGYPSGPVLLPALVALVTAVAAGHRVAAYAVAGVGYAAYVAALVVRTGGDPELWGGAAGLLAWLVAVVAASEFRRARVERRAQQRAAEEEAVLRRGSEERLRIAQELHDVLGHHVSLINVQAGVALYLMDDDPEQARAALTTIKRSSKDLLREMRSTLGVLRGVDEPPPHHPTPGLAQLPRLLDDVRAAGLPVELDSKALDLPTGVDLAAYRIVQEALTNTRRHAGPATARVRLRREEGVLTVQVDDDGRGPGGPGPEPGGGNGLPGMRERARALGGTCEAGPGPDGGFRVLARLPIGGTS